MRQIREKGKNKNKLKKRRHNEKYEKQDKRNKKRNVMTWNGKRMGIYIKINKTAG
jgi:hypothetical protein